MKTTFVGDEDKNKIKSQQAHKGEAEKVHVAGLKGGQRVKMMSSAEVEEVKSTENADKVARSGGRVVVERIRGKKYKDAKAKFDHDKLFNLKDAVKLVKDSSYSKFEGTMELHIVVKKVGTSAAITLPFTAGRTKKVEIADESTIEKLKTGTIDFDILVATQEMMPKLVPFARLLGPKGLMPNPKNGTLVPDLKKAKSYSTGTITIKTEKEAPLIHTVVGKVKQNDEEIIANTEAIFKALGGVKQITKAYMKSSMSPSVKLQLN